MEPMDTTKQFWQENKIENAGNAPLSNKELKQIIRGRIRKEKKTIAEYFWASFVWQLFVYSFMCHLLVKYWGNTEITFLSLAMIILFLPYTYMLYKKIRAIFLPSTNAMNSPTQDIQANVNGQYNLLSVFFRFKKWCDRIAIPLSCFILTAIVFELYVTGGVAGNMIAAIIIYLITLSLFIVATYFENKKRFIIPLQHFKAILTDIEETK
jgi:hypothetical protein